VIVSEAIMPGRRARVLAFVAAHPDDDVMGAAGIVALRRDDPDLRFVLIHATDGEAGEIAPGSNITRRTWVLRAGPRTGPAGRPSVGSPTVTTGSGSRTAWPSAPPPRPLSSGTPVMVARGSADSSTAPTRSRRSTV
jgi:hypothetical protein